MTSKSATNERHRLIKLIHVAKRELGMDDDSYRSMLAGLPSLKGKTSAGQCNISQLNAVLEHMKKCGFKVRSINKGRSLASDPQSKKIRALWLDLHASGLVRDPSEKALSGFVSSITGVNALQWLSSNDASRVIETLKKWLQRNKRKDISGDVTDE